MISDQSLVDTYGGYEGVVMDQLALTTFEHKYSISQMRFPQKLWHLLATRSDAVQWGSGGHTVLINSHVLDAYLISNASIFKTRHMSSFIRQLNLYGFRKVTSHLQDPVCNASNPHMYEYAHDYFVAGRPDLLPEITRRTINVRGADHNRPKYSIVASSGAVLALERARSRLQAALRRAAHALSLEPPPPPRISCCTYLSKDGSNSEDAVSMDVAGPPPLHSGRLGKVMSSLKKNLTQLWQNPDVPLPTSSIEHPDPDILEEKVILIQDEDSCFDSSPMDSTSSFGAQVSLATGNISDAVPAHFLTMPELAGSPQPELSSVLPNTSLEGVSRSAQYQREWNVMCEELTGHRVPQADGGSDLKDLYYQISRTMDLLNS